MKTNPQYCRHLFVSCLVVLALGLQPTRVVQAGDNNNALAKEDIWWEDGALVKSAIISYLKLEDKSPSIRGSELSSEIFYLLLLYDSMSSQESLRSLTSLTSYNLGAFPSEIYYCLLVRKGTAIKALLSAVQKTDHNECFEQLGGQSKRCLNRAERDKEIAIVFKRIDEKEACKIDR